MGGADARAADAAANRLFSLIQKEIYELAGHMVVGEPRDACVTAHGLAHEAYIRLAKSLPSVNDRRHLMRLIGKIMRQIKLDWARARNAKRRGPKPESLDTGNLRLAEAFQYKESPQPDSERLLALDEGLAVLEKRSPLDAELLGLILFAEFEPRDIVEYFGWSVSEFKDKKRKAILKLSRILAAKPH